MKYTSEIIGHRYVRLLKDGNLMYTHEAASELNRLHAALEQIKLYHENMHGEKAKTFIAYDIACKALEVGDGV